MEESAMDELLPAAASPKCVLNRREESREHRVWPPTSERTIYRKQPNYDKGKAAKLLRTATFTTILLALTAGSLMAQKVTTDRTLLCRRWRCGAAHGATQEQQTLATIYNGFPGWRWELGRCRDYPSGTLPGGDVGD